MIAFTENDNINRQLAFVLEVDKLKHILRQTLLTDASRRENDAEHSWHLALMAVVLQDYAGEGVDLSRVLQMVTLHDLVEIDAGDTFAYDAAGNRDKLAREQAAADRIFGLLPGEQGDALRALWEEFDQAATPSARFACALDRLQPLLHNFVTEGHTWTLGHITSAMVLQRMDPIRTAVPALWPVVEHIVAQSVARGYLPG